MMLEDFVPAEANMGLSKVSGLIWAFGCPFAIFGTNMDARPFADMDLRNFNVLYEDTGIDVQGGFTRV